MSLWLNRDKTYDLSQVSPKRSLGQVFLTDQNLARKIVKALEPQQGETIVEIGPGRGALTKHLLRHDGMIILIEKDEKLAESLISKWCNHERLRVIAQDATLIDLSLIIPGTRFSVIGNLPYNVANPILFSLLKYQESIRKMVLMFQKEVAQRLMAKSGDRHFNATSLFLQMQTKITHAFDCPPQAFFPKPKVWSSVLVFEFRRDINQVVRNPLFLDFLHKIFSRPRKNIVNSICYGLKVEKKIALQAIEKANMRPNDRPSDLDENLALCLWEFFLPFFEQSKMPFL